MIITDEKKVEEVLSRGVAEVIEYSELKDKLLSGKRLRIKLGIDPTSPDIHVGRSVPLLKLRDFQDLGHHVILLIGNFTGTIGDTSDKEAERPMIDQETIDKNMKTYFDQAAKILDMEKVEQVYNADWLGKLTYGEISKQANIFSLAEFSARDNVRRRLDAGTRVSLREMLYPLMQGYDSVALKADVEIGGTDQRFNLLAGRKMQPHYDQEPQNIVTFPIIEGLDGRKMSSSWGNKVNLMDDSRDMYGKLMTLSDEYVTKYFTQVTRVPMDDIRKMEVDLESGELHPRDAKMQLAREITRMYHCEKCAEDAENFFKETFQQNRIPEDITEVVVEQYTPLIDIVLQEKLLTSKGEFRRLVEQGGLTNLDAEEKITTHEAVADKTMTLKVGKRKFLRVVVR